MSDEEVVRRLLSVAQGGRASGTIALDAFDRILSERDSLRAALERHEEVVRQLEAILDRVSKAAAFDCWMEAADVLDSLTSSEKEKA